MPPIRSLVSERHTHTIAVILLLGKIMPSYSYCEEKKLVYIVIIASFGRQPSFCIKCTKLNICSSYNVRSVSNVKCVWFTYLITF